MKKGLLVFMVLPILLMLFNNTAYRHEHILQDGTKIVHAHPFDSSGSNPVTGRGHKHTDMELHLYSLITDSPLLFSQTIFCPGVFRQKESDFITFLAQTTLYRESVSITLLRAPPAGNYSEWSSIS